MNKEVIEAWADIQGPTVFSTVSDDGMPNSVYMGMYRMLDDGRIALANNYFQKTMSNIRGGSAGSFLFITGKRVSYQLKGVIDYLDSGPVFEDMKKWNRSDLPGLGVAVLTVTEIYRGAEKLL